MLLKGQLHVHTTFSDGTLTPQEVAEAYARLGFDFIAYSDHDHLLKENYRAVIESVKTDMLVLFGIELTIATRLGYVHVTRIEGETETLHIFNHPGDYGFTLRQTLECIEDVSRVCRVDAVEITHCGFYTPAYDVDAVPFPKVATDDSHTVQGCGRSWIEVEAGRSGDAIIRAIKQGKAIPRFTGGIIDRPDIVIA
jgi:hypothetical protein